MSTNEDRRAELIAAAVGDDLSAAEQRELDDLVAVDPSTADEIDELRLVVGRMRAALPNEDWDEVAPPRVGDVVPAAVPNRARAPQARPRRPMLLAAAAGVCILAGVGGVLGVQAVSSRPVTGPPGTLGAYEEIEFTAATTGIDVDGGLVAHTWGTETVLEVTGAETDAVYEVILVENSGSGSASGTFLGSDVEIDCRMNAAVTRAEVTGVEIRTASGEVVASARVAAVS